MGEGAAMSNAFKGQHLYSIGDAETRDWFHRQWKIWPKRADERLTTNISLHYGGVLAYRAEHDRDPEMSKDFASHVAWHDKNNLEEAGQLVEVQADDATVERVARAICKAHAFDTTGVTEDAANAIADHAVQAWIPEAIAAIEAMKGPKL